MACGSQEAMGRPNAHRETTLVRLQFCHVLKRPCFHLLLPCCPLPSRDVLRGDDREGVWMLPICANPEKTVVDVHRMVGVQGHNHALDLLPVRLQQIGDPLRVLCGAVNGQRATLMEIVLRIDDEKGHAAGKDVLWRNTVHQSCSARLRAESSHLSAEPAMKTHWLFACMRPSVTHCWCLELCRFADGHTTCFHVCEKNARGFLESAHRRRSILKHHDV